MRIIQMLTKQHPKAMLRTGFRTVQGMITNEAATRCKEQVSIGTGQTRERVEIYAIDGYEGGSGKARLWEELDPMRIVVIGHERLH
jgi:hypothetical protein